MDWTPLWLTFKLASLTTLVLLVLGMPIAYWLAYGRFRGKFLVEAIVALPLVLPPSVLGFYLLVAFSPENALGNFLRTNFGLDLVFSFPGILLGSVLYSLPFMVQPLQSGFFQIPKNLKEAALTLGKSPFQIFFRVLLPNMKPAVLTALVLSFAHTVGEFGVVLMIGGSIPGQTRVASIAIYDQVEAMDYAEANFYAAVLFVLSLTVLLGVYGYRSFGVGR